MAGRTNRKELIPPADGAYRAFLLRCWQEPGTGQEREAAWRFALVPAGDEERIRVFASMEEMVRYLRQVLNRSV